ncbi:MAG TPA: hypothetical protein DDY45_15065, partial [Verrucomicrobiales bacterium]|nr:hypothetical protein [Verrucomicrobiales bacterium]
ATTTTIATIPVHQKKVGRAIAKASTVKNTAHSGKSPQDAPAKHARANETRGATATKCLHFLCTHATI